jgi:L-ascorbate metabolism protein UlaG (beta-lactamase superfamily)
MIKPYIQGKALADEISHAKATGRPDALDIWWLGQSGFLLQWNKRYLLFDPYLSDSLTKKYARTDKPHERMSELVIEPSLLTGIDIVTSSHNHTDHLDAETLLPIFYANPDITFVIPEANRVFVVDRLGCDPDFPVGLNDGISKIMDGITITGVPAAHNELERNEKGECLYMGYVVRFGDFTVYHSGDTLWYDGMEDILKPFHVDAAFLPINGNKPERRVAGNLNGDEAAQLGKAIKAKLVIPHHYDLFRFNTADPYEFAHAAEQIQQPYRILSLGERLTIHA